MDLLLLLDKNTNGLWMFNMTESLAYTVERKGWRC